MIIANQLSKRYNDGQRDISVFDDLSFSIDAGQTIALMGQSGSGKSTLLHILGGFDNADDGSVKINNHNISTMNDSQLSEFRRLNLGMIFQQFNLIPSLNALDNISFVRRLNGLPEQDDFCLELIDVLGLSNRLTHFPAQLSGGEQQRVAIARAIATKPQVLLADEPTGNLDEQTAANVMELLVKAVGLDNITLLLVTHSQATASYLQNTWQLSQGKLSGSATTNQ